MAINRPNQPDDEYSQAKAAAGNSARGAAGTGSHAADSTSMKGQYPPGDWGNAIFGGQLPTGTGAPGSAGERWDAGDDPTNMPGQVEDTFTGIPESQIGSTGAPGTATNPDGASGGTEITYTRAGSYLSGSYQSAKHSDHTDGPQDSTQANDQGYATGGPQLPALKGNEPQAGSGRFQPGGGRVMRGGRMYRG